ncbi:dihydrolipoamide acetyltransferase family protein [Nocardioides terrigena]|uniref:dihydrolipoamide acetyltransferase family protein n=1 Tax=Nocardioides terrigena TaxID=424797 RepID=UPI000D3137D9|nr:dihydrolipoamide acetyltransferase family protein [Nocardioides terrigena]
MSEFKLPDVGEGLTEAEIVSWKVKAGDSVEINDIIVEIETAKSIVELPSPYAGTVLALMVDEGQMVDVGTPIISIGSADEAAAAAAAPAAPQTESDPYLGMAQKAGEAQVDLSDMDLSNPAASGGGEGESLVGRNKAERGPQRRARKGSATPRTAAGAQTQLQLQGAFAPGGARTDEVAPVDEPAVPATSAAPRPAAEPAEALVPPAAQTPHADVRALAKPPVRKLAKDLGVDLSMLLGSGAGGVVTRTDVEAAAAGGGTDNGWSPATETPTPRRTDEAPRETREPIKGVRKMMAQAMSHSAFTSPHVTEWVTVDVTATMQLVERLKARRELKDVRISPLLVLARAVLLAMKRTPEINSYWDDAAQEVVYKSYVNLGIAAATPRGLVVPNVKDADAMSMVELAGALGELTATARDGKTQPAEMAGGTFTITNVGVFGVDAGTPIINPGESAILCFGAINKRPWVSEEGEIVVRDVTTLALSFDHRHIDGEKGSRFLADVAGILGDPGSALLF